MTKFNLNAAAIAILAASVFAVSCKKDQQQQAPAEKPVGANLIVPANGATLSGVLGTGKTVRDTIHLTGGTYLLQGLVYVDTLDVIKIDAGTTIKGIVGAPGGTLVVTRGAKIEANGTATQPIVFTSNSGSPASGQIGGLVILGRAKTNQTNPLIEGIGGTPPADTHYGGTQVADNSGILKYVRIQYAGYELSTDNELNGLTLGGVGSGTTIDFVEVYKAADDGIEFFGGDVNASHLVVVNPLDDGLDFDNGYTGRIQYALVVEDSTRADKSTSNGIESDNNSVGSQALPITKPLIANLTIIGLPSQALATKTNFLPSGTGKYGVVAHWRRSSQFQVYNSVFLGFERGFLLDNTVPAGGTTVDTQEKYRDGVSIIKNNLVHAFTTPFASNPAYPFTATKAYPAAADNNSGFANALNANAAIRLVNPFNRGIAGFYRPGNDPLNPSPAATGGLTTGLPAGIVGTSFRGAVSADAAADWITGWTVLGY
ncbi:hypothetical protein [Chitinophaga nivalis]|uniref:T9SS C-terminal target domain-containing protein n=1 Tax=Chitinophaga nivalis TaxID=2991709 RepID=A0ABT3IIZ1_9BACT|nr:hypothetical protein [Chitinophaga nivalis]MCW3466595.1 hypothetical protein [Chitinophaga nivalis]MCW3483714.1 hypothetical protein [Chitinophaga nivalis]